MIRSPSIGLYKVSSKLVSVRLHHIPRKTLQTNPLMHLNQVQLLPDTTATRSPTALSPDPAPREPFSVPFPEFLHSNTLVPADTLPVRCATPFYAGSCVPSDKAEYRVLKSAGRVKTAPSSISSPASSHSGTHRKICHGNPAGLSICTSFRQVIILS